MSDLPAANPGFLARAKGQGMRLWDSLRGSTLGMMQRAAGIFDNWNVPIWDYTQTEQQLQAGNGRVWAAYKACDIISNIAITTEWNLQKADSFEPESDDNIMAVLDAPNPFEDMEDIMRRWVFHMKLCGKAYCLKDEMNGKGQAKKLWSLNPKFVTRYMDQQFGIVGYSYRLLGREIPFDVDEIIHWKLASHTKDFDGLGAVEGGGKLFQRFGMLDDFQTAFVKNGARPSSLMIYEDVVKDEAEWQKVKAKWDQEHGRGQSGKTAWLSGKWKHQQLGSNLKDMEFSAMMLESKQEIFSLMGIPYSMTGMQESGKSFASAQVEDVQFRRYTIYPLLYLFAKKFNREFIQKWNPDLYLVYMLGGLGSISAIVNDYKDLVSLGAMTPNELREVVGLDPADDDALDKFYLTVAIQAIDDADSANAPHPQGGGFDAAGNPLANKPFIAPPQRGGEAPRGQDNQTRNNDPIKESLPRKAADIVRRFKAGTPLGEPDESGILRTRVASKIRNKNLKWDHSLRKFGPILPIGKPLSGQTRRSG